MNSGDFLTVGFTLYVILVGLVITFVGYRLLKLSLGLIGFTLGAFLVATLVSLYITGEQITILAAGVCGGIVGALFLILLYRVGIFTIGMIAGGTLGAVAAAPAGGDLGWLLILLFALFGGLIAMLLQKSVLVAATALVGSWLVIASVTKLAGLDVSHVTWLARSDTIDVRNTLNFFIVAAWLFLAITGIVFQHRGRRK